MLFQWNENVEMFIFPFQDEWNSKEINAIILSMPQIMRLKMDQEYDTDENDNDEITDPVSVSHY